MAKTPPPIGADAFRTVTAFPDGYDDEESTYKKVVVTKYMDWDIMKKKLMDKLNLLLITKVYWKKEGNDNFPYAK